jgi:hypothetical protein
MAFFIHARDAAGCITLRRESRGAAVKKAEELRAMGYFEVEIVEQARLRLPNRPAQLDCFSGPAPSFHDE